jgi:hypothetical protein
MSAHHVDYGAKIANAPRAIPGPIKSAGIALLVIGLGSAAFGVATDPTRTAGAFITNFMYFMGLSQGALMLAVASVITKGRWARPIKRMAEAFSLMTIPMYILLMGFMSFVVLTKAHVYPWAYDLESMPAHKHTYFQPMFVLGRLGLLNGLLVVLNLLFVRASVRSDMGVAKERFGWEPTGLAAMIAGIGGWKGEKAEVEASQKFQVNLAPPLAMVYAVAFSVMAVDVSMSLAPHWYTNMFSAWYFMSSFWSGIIWLGMFSLLFKKQLGLDAVIKPAMYHDLGKMTFGLTMFWGYTTFAQYLPIWYGNMTEEIGYILLRTELEPWATITKAVFMMCFVMPFAMLTSRGLKKTPTAYLLVTFLLASGIWLERFLVNMPGVWMKETLPLGVPELGMAAGFIGLLLLTMWSFMTSAPPLVFTDPFLQADPDHVHVLPKSQQHAHGH